MGTYFAGDARAAPTLIDLPPKISRLPLLKHPSSPDAAALASLYGSDKFQVRRVLLRFLETGSCEYVKKRAPKTTVLVCIGGNGSMLDPFLVHSHRKNPPLRPGEKKRGRPRTKNLVCPMRRDHPLIVCPCEKENVNGMRASHFEFWIEHCVIPWVRGQVGDLAAKGAGLIIDQLGSHFNANVRKLLAAANITPLYLYPKTSDELSPLDNGFFGHFKRTMRQRLMEVERTEQGVTRAIRSVLSHMGSQRESIVGFFKHCGYDGSGNNGRKYVQGKEALTVLPFGLPPASARLGRLQKKADLVAVRRRGRPRKLAMQEEEEKEGENAESEEEN